MSARPLPITDGSNFSADNYYFFSTDTSGNTPVLRETLGKTEDRMEGFMHNRVFFSAKNVATLSVLTALVVIMQAFGASVSFGAVQLNFTLVPIVLGALVSGVCGGAFLGFACGIVVLLQVIAGTVPFYTLIWTETPIAAAATCLLKTTFAGAAAGFLFRKIEKKNKNAAIVIATASVPVINTGLFVVGCFFMKSAIASVSGGQNILLYILVSLVTFNFFIELAVNLVCVPVIKTVYDVAAKYTRKNRE